MSSPKHDASADGADGAPVRRRPGRPRHEEPSAEYIKRRNEIIDVAANVFQAHGYDAGSLDHVAAELDLGKASLYYYVRSKAELLYLVFDRAISIALAQMEQLVHDQHASPRERLAALVHHQVDTVTSDLSLFSVFFDQRSRLSEEYAARIRSKERRYLQLFVETVNTAVESGFLGQLEPRYAAQALLGVANWTYKWFDPARDEPRAYADVAVALLLGRPADDRGGTRRQSGPVVAGSRTQVPTKHLRRS